MSGTARPAILGYHRTGRTTSLGELSMPAALTPRVRTLLACEGVKPSQVEEHVFHLKGVRYWVSAGGFPFVPARLWLFLLLSSPRKGRFPGHIRIVNDRTDRVVFIGKLTPTPVFQDDHEFLPVPMRLKCTFPQPGRYVIQVCFFQETFSDIVKAEMPLDVVEEV